ncbi:MAG TPA: hypothetical protein VM616_01055 [Gammaproteobacteria bacterium]|nr:hypothetical protein [Gammaproteobacteria bacterium]
MLVALVAGSLHVQTVYACNAMGERLQAACCCEEPDSTPCGEAESCGPGGSSATQPCCEISYSAGLDDEALFTPSAQSSKSDWNPLALPPSVSPLIPAGSHAPDGEAAQSSAGFHASPIYLTTRRLRI